MDKLLIHMAEKVIYFSGSRYSLVIAAQDLSAAEGQKEVANSG